MANEPAAAPLFNDAGPKGFASAIEGITSAVTKLGSALDALSNKTKPLTSLSSRLSSWAGGGRFGGMANSSSGNGGPQGNTTGNGGPQTTSGFAGTFAGASGGYNAVANDFAIGGWGDPYGQQPGAAFAPLGMTGQAAGYGMTGSWSGPSSSGAAPNGGSSVGGTGGWSTARGVAGAAVVAAAAAASYAPTAINQGTTWSQLGKWSQLANGGGSLQSNMSYAQQFNMGTKGVNQGAGDVLSAMQTLNGSQGYGFGTSQFNSAMASSKALATVSQNIGGTLNISQAAGVNAYIRSAADQGTFASMGASKLYSSGNANLFNLAEYASQRTAQLNHSKNTLLTSKQLQSSSGSGEQLNNLLLQATGGNQQAASAAISYLSAQQMHAGPNGTGKISMNGALVGVPSLGTSGTTAADAAALAKLGFAGTVTSNQNLASSITSNATQKIDVQTASTAANISLQAAKALQDATDRFGGFVTKLVGGATGGIGATGIVNHLKNAGADYGVYRGGKYVKGKISKVRANRKTPAGGDNGGDTGGGDAASTDAAAEFSETLSGLDAAGFEIGGGGASSSGVSPGGLSAPAGGSSSSIVTDAQRYLGDPYRWGGPQSGPGYDCSGLVQQVFKDEGVGLPRTAAQQSKVGQAVNGIKNARAGDLVFYGGNGYDGSPSNPGHVGIYVGNNKMIDAPYPGTNVRYDNVGNPVAIRRVLGANGSAASSGASNGGASNPTGGGVSGSGYMGLIGEGNASTEGGVLSAALVPTFMGGITGGAGQLGGTGGNAGGNGVGTGGNPTIPSAPNTPPNSVAALAQKMAAAKGWTGQQWNALYAVEMDEAGWNLNAQNPNSKAYGIAQFINGASEYQSYGGNSSTASGQITAFLNYVEQRYGTPTKALAHENALHWYEVGSQNIDSDQMAMLHRGEMVVRAGSAAAMRMNQLSSSGSGAGVTVLFNKGAVVYSPASSSASTASTGGSTVQQDMDDLADKLSAALEKRLGRNLVGAE